MTENGKQAGVDCELDGTDLVLRFDGVWSTRHSLPASDDQDQFLEQHPDISQVRLVTSDNLQFDSSLASYIHALLTRAHERDIEVELSGLPKNLVRLIEIARQTGKAEDSADFGYSRKKWIEEFGDRMMDYLNGSLEIATFTGEWVIALTRLAMGRSKLRWRDFWAITKSVTSDALPIVALISFLVGAIISFLGAVTLKKFGAEFAVAYLVGFGILREMGAIMTGIIMAGRSGAAFAAQIGSMKINEELDALKTLGISPIDFIVLPRLLALFLAMPLLTLYSNVIAIMSGWLVAEGLMNVPGPVFFEEMQSVLNIWDFLLGIFKAGVFGVLVATAGCLRGLQSGSGAGAVGVAATRAVVAGITLIVFSNAVIDWAAATIGI